MKHVKHLWLCSLLLMVSCAMLPRAESPIDGVAITYVSIESASNTTTQLLQAGMIDVDVAIGIRDVLERAHYLNTLAEKYALGGKPDNALEILVMINAILSDVQIYLEKF